MNDANAMRMQCEWNAYYNHMQFPTLIHSLWIGSKAMVKYAHETREAFVSRVVKERGLGGKGSKPLPRSKVQPRPVEEILADQIAAHDRRASGLFRFGPAERWRAKA
jgi:hypothetical protein